jgi:release factor glutamine methyltransferase
MTDCRAPSLPPPSLIDALRDAAAQLSSMSDTARLDAELLAAHLLGLGRMEMLAQLRDLAVPAGLDALIARRVEHEPVAYITGSQAFWDLELSVTPDVLIPRADSETLIEAAQAAFAGLKPPARLLDLGTGSGALLLAALSLFPAARGLGMDASAAALVVAAGNADALGFAERVEMRRLSWRDTGWAAALKGPFNLILCNPPYIESHAPLSPMVADYEPHEALFAGADGLDDYRILLPALPGLLAQGGVAVVEIGYNQAESVGDLARDIGLKTSLSCDLAGNPRCLTLQYN